MAMRNKEIDPGGPVDRNSPEQFKLRSANQMAAMLEEWDREAALPILKARVERGSRVIQAGQKAGGRLHGMEDSIASLTELRLGAADPQALDDYAAWVRTVTPDHFDFPPIAMFRPMWRNPDHPEIAAAAVALFDDPKSPWNPQVWRGDATVAEGQQRGLFATPLLGLKAFRTLVIRALGDRTEVGTIETGANGRVIVIQGHYRTVSDGERTEHGIEFAPEGPKDPHRPGPKAMPLRMADMACEALEHPPDHRRRDLLLRLRMADMACEALEQLEGIPRFKKPWPIAKRDEAIAATVAYLTRYGERFRENAAARAIRAREPGFPNHEGAILAFDPLDRPATAADVAEGRAIFSLDGAGAEVRHVALPTFPMSARWTKLEVFADDPPFMSVTNDKGNNHPYIEGMQTGRVWQAEEVREGDRWRRFYGFVGRHALTRVPAEEVEFPASWSLGRWRVSADLDARILVEERDAAATGPIPIEVQFRNHRGVETTAPADLVRPADGAFTIREGIAFRLVRVSDKPSPRDPFAGRQGDAPESPFSPEEIAARPIARHPKTTASQPLAPAGEASAFRIDLQALFPVDRPGRYRLEITFDDLKGADGSPGKATREFGVVSRTKD